MTATGTKGSRRLVVVIVALALMVVVVLVALSRGNARSTEPFDPQSPTPNGSLALARVLEQQGVQVIVARGVTSLRRQQVGPDTTVFVASTDYLDDLSADALLEHSREAERLVVATSEGYIVDALDVEASVRSYPAGDLPTAGTCPGTDARSGEQLSRVEAGFALEPTPAASTCFERNGVSAYLRLDRTPARAPLVLLSEPRLWTNQLVGEHDQGALALRTLGQSARVVWYVPTIGDAQGGFDVLVDRELPPWFTPALLLGTLVLLGVMVWRGRRLGRLVPEPLPVLIRAIETTQSRGAMYRRTRDTARSGHILRDASARRLGAWLGLPKSSTPDAVAERVAAVTGRDPGSVHATLTGPPPANEAELLALATALADLEHAAAPSSHTARPTPERPTP